MRVAAGNEALIALFEREGYTRVEPPILQPADVFLELSGEDIRRRIFVTQDLGGRELCLRPEYTIPVCREHLTRIGASPGSYSYLGPVFRLRPNETGEFLQAGIESIGRRDAAAADAEVLALALEGLEALGAGPVAVKLGDMGLLEAILEGLGLAASARRRLMRAVVSGRGVDGFAENAPAQGIGEHAGLLAAIEGQAPHAARAFVEDILSIAGISTVGGRSAGEIAERFLARASNRTGAVPEEARTILNRYLAIAGDPDAAAAAIRALARDADMDLERSIDALEERIGFMAVRGLDIANFRFAADFVRNLDYYTGFVFEIADPRREDGKPLVGGGRYDRLLRHLGAAEPIAAVGCSFWLERIGNAG
jgi:ATP phosphoribosyltransferase regulatory subunit